MTKISSLLLYLIYFEFKSCDTEYDKCETSKNITSNTCIHVYIIIKYYYIIIIIIFISLFVKLCRFSTSFTRKVLPVYQSLVKPTCQSRYLYWKWIDYIYHVFTSRLYYLFVYILLKTNNTLTHCRWCDAPDEDKIYTY